MLTRSENRCGSTLLLLVLTICANAVGCSPEAAEQADYRPITMADNIPCGARVKSMDIRIGGHPNGELGRYECVTKDGETVNLELVDTAMVDGRIETKDFGVILLKSTGVTTADYYMTEDQMKRIRSFLGYAVPE